MFSSDIQQMSSCVQTKLCCCTVLSVAPKCQFQSSRQHSEGEGVIFQILQCSVRAGCLMLLIFLVFCDVCFLVVFVFVCLRSVLCSQCFLCLWIIHSRLPLRVSLTFNNIDIPHDIRVLRGKTLTNDTDTYFCVMQSTSQQINPHTCRCHYKY